VSSVVWQAQHIASAHPKAATTEMFCSRQCKKMEETIQRLTTNSYTRKQANKEWFDEQCVKVEAPRKKKLMIKKMLTKKKGH
jgi:hypothetical protein